MNLRIKRIYEPADPADGHRVLVDRLWPRGLAREAAAVDLWLRDLAPSKALREWFAHDTARWDAFRSRYRTELETEPAAQALAQLRALLAGHPTLTLLYAARDEAHNNAVALRECLLDATGGGAPGQ